MTVPDFVSNVIGSGVGGGAIAGAIYASAVSIEKEARPEARNDVARFLRGFGVGSNVQLIARHISGWFEVLFGSRHFTLKCALRSLALTAAFCSASVFFVWIRQGDILTGLWNERLGPTRSGINPVFRELFVFALAMLVFSAVPDFLALWKSRAILKYVSRSRGIITVLWFLLLDLLSTFMIIYLWLVLASIPVQGISGFSIEKLILTFPAFTQQLIQTYAIPFSHKRITDFIEFIPAILFTSTILTTLWTFAILFSALLIRATVPLHYPIRMLGWLYGVEEHPIKIVGTVAAGLIWLGAVIYGLL